ncbi:unnamed protein product [Soboliphyme baturini]|uniref:Transmembrane protein n=1 Tax=Soboliphyme baturini TaxID=241478 RepID=A0A183IZG5_9BILA|nr:unnamed protein product [Soboliphyme baturini]
MRSLHFKPRKSRTPENHRQHPHNWTKAKRRTIVEMASDIAARVFFTTFTIHASSAKRSELETQLRPAQTFFVLMLSARLRFFTPYFPKALQVMRRHWQIPCKERAAAVEISDAEKQAQYRR